ncbi:MAG TPA: hypothetical protein VFI61_03290 [Patescibacteria group bacterium]|nr:hypothetical protein [Patescibacteria group bacterium]
MNSIGTLNEFVDMALRNRKYASNSAYGYKAALKIFDEELSDEERNSLDLFKERFDQIFSTIVNKKSKVFSISSLQTYKFRVLKVLSDYEKYGKDPSKMSSWSPNVRKINPSKIKIERDNESKQLEAESETISEVGYSRHEYSLRPSKKLIISYPSDFTLEEANSVKSFAEYLISMKSENKS